MTKTLFMSLLQNPENVSEEHLDGIREMGISYPYFAFSHILLAKLLKTTQDTSARQYARIASLYASNSRWLYYYLYPDQIPLSAKQGPVPRFSGDYFSMMENVEAQGGDTRETLRSLAERLKTARDIIVDEKPKERIAATEQKKSARIATPDYFAEKTTSESDDKISEKMVKKLIREKKYSEAIEILHKLNLVYPKKSVYFAAQIQFLEKIIENSTT
jgi:hypothetical protein